MTSEANLSSPEARIGEIVDGRYRLVQHIASGGMASVYRAEHVHTRAPFAVKVLHRELSDNAEISARFQREIQACRSVQHAHVIAATDFGRLLDGCLFMVLEYTPGDDLCVVLHHQKPFDQPRALKVALQVTLALTAAHAAGVVHRDLKPDNIMLIQRDGDPDYVKVVDFGIAKLPPRGQPLTALGSIFGTPEYMAPEQARGGQVDHRTDLYTVGIVLYEMLTGATPFAGPNVGQVIIAQLTQQPPPLPGHVDPELTELIGRLLAKDPNTRPQTAVELAAHLLRILRRLAPSHPVLGSVPVASFAATAPNLPPLVPEHLLRAAAPVAHAPQPVAHAPQSVAHAPQPVAHAPQSVAQAPQPVAHAPQPVAHAPQPAQPVAPPPQPVAHPQAPPVPHPTLPMHDEPGGVRVPTAPMSARAAQPAQAPQIAGSPQTWPDEPIEPPPKTSSGWLVAVVVLMLMGVVATLLAVVILWLT